MRYKWSIVGVVVVAGVLVAACGANPGDVVSAGSPTATEPSATQPNPTPTSANNVEAVSGDAEVILPKPENRLSEQEYSWSQLLQRDDILPVYNPEFVPADDAPYDDDELVIGVTINGEAKAYAIGPLNSREMVNDTVGGMPVLVTW